jgi:Ser/Thr protein kinase RdoA (MazF antagonist)
MLAKAVEENLDAWAEAEGGRAHLVNLSENHTFRIDRDDGRRFILRVHRPGYQSSDAIESELAWIRALRRDAGLPVPVPLAGKDGRLLQHLSLGHDGPRAAVLFRFEAGREPRESEKLEPLFMRLGEIAAHLHRHAETFVPPAGFARPRWDAASVLDADGLWGDWRKAPKLTGEGRAILTALDRRLRDDLAGYGTGGDRFGLIHADMRLANILVDGDAVTLLDFDDCGFCWFAYDFAAAVSFFEDSPVVPALKAAWLEAYRRIRPLSAEDIEAMDTMLLLRRMALLAWIDSHAETELARSHASTFAEGTVRMAERYLAQ